MDLEDWELVLPKNSFKDLDLDHDEDHHGSMVMDYFLCPSTKDPLPKTESPPSSIVVPKKLLQVPIAWEAVLDQDNTKKPNKHEPDPDPDSNQTLSTDFVSSPRVSFKIMKETEFADMKIDPPARITSPLPQIDAAAASKPSDLEGGGDLRDKKEVVLEEEDEDGSGGERLNLWKVGLNGIGAICSFGVAAAAATVCVFFLGHNNIKICKNKNQMLRFQIYSDDNKRMKEVVNHATKLNEAIFGMKGVPVVRAQISFGGHYDGL
ncbi:hypothetical protein ISN45_Aa03g003490 [Arabidopsis thaliana x Arabidopsis arenosa]|uniref:DUF6821 domain-containing protein n=1 Tax=Arabidopsis thaliana x Arabidopsis arenosa TaxID=1240361 RepID=A0A8T2APK4_9BRAS|nr:hypothetical protein ISN45_Aa03g003490 [Arabidopsis thaliana x Arabidopsis arenosa]